MPLPTPSRALRSALACVLMAGAGAALAEKADRSLPMVVESDGRQAASVDLARKVTVLTGNVVITQGTLRIDADRVEIREVQAGRYRVLATATGGGQVKFRQKRDKVDEYIEAQADSADQDGLAETVRFTGRARLKVTRPGGVADEAQAATITYDQRQDTIVFDGGSVTSGSGAPQPGRARLVFVPRSAEPAASAASGAPR